MKPPFVLVVAALMVVIASVVSCAQTADEAPDEAGLSNEGRDQIGQMLVEWEHDWVNSVREGDPSVLERILAPDFIYTVGTGEVREKSSFIASAVSDDFTYESFEIEDVEVRWYTDEVVVITGTALWSGEDAAGELYEGRSRWTNVFVERDGEWRVVVGHSTPVD